MDRHLSKSGICGKTNSTERTWIAPAMDPGLDVFGRVINRPAISELEAAG